MRRISLKNQKGVGLLEMLLALSIAAIIIAMSARYYNNYKRMANISRLQGSVAQLMDALNAYYYMNCKNPLVTSVNVKTLQDAGLVGTNLYNPWDNNQFTVAIINTTGGSQDKAFYRLMVSASMNTKNAKYNASLAQYIRGALNADTTSNNDDNRVTWFRIPQPASDDLGSRQWAFNAKLPGTGQMTAVGAGGSKFWILNSQLQSFTKLEDKNACPN